MAEGHRTFMITSPHMQGGDIKRWQEILNRQFVEWNVEYHVAVDGDYGVPTRNAAAMVLTGLGINLVHMRDGVTPELRDKVRNKELTPTENLRRIARRPWRHRLRLKYAGGGVSSPVHKILASSWGWHAAGSSHDGVDLICPENAPIFAICKSKVIDVRVSGWWGASATASAGHAVSEGDGIIQLECLVDVGPFRRGMHFGYGHAEHATVSVGDTVAAGDRVGRAGFANAWHVHFMANGGTTTQGIGDRDPMPFVDYAIEHG